MGCVWGGHWTETEIKQNGRTARPARTVEPGAVHTVLRGMRACNDDRPRVGAPACGRVCRLAPEFRARAHTHTPGIGAILANLISTALFDSSYPSLGARMLLRALSRSSKPRLQCHRFSKGAGAPFGSKITPRSLRVAVWLKPCLPPPSFRNSPRPLWSPLPLHPLSDHGDNTLELLSP